jgi:hypothetical protein
VRIALFARHLPGTGRGWHSGGACLWVATARGLVYGAVCTVAVAGGLLPAWLITVPVLGLAVLAGAAACLKGRTTPPPQPRLLLAWAGLSAATRVGAGVCVLAAVGAPRPVTSALIGLTALGASAAVPLAPGGAGLAGAGMALALGHSGVPASTAIAAAVAFHSLETLAGVAFGGAGSFALKFAVCVVRVETGHAVSVLPREGASAVRAPRGGGARRAPRRQHSMGIRAAHVPARDRRRRHRPPGDHGEVCTILYRRDYQRLRRKYRTTP